MFGFRETVTKDFEKCNELIIWTGTLFFNWAKNRFLLNTNHINWMLFCHMIAAVVVDNLLVITAICCRCFF